MSELRFGNILGFTTSIGKRIVFHTERLEAGEIDHDGWLALSALQAHGNAALDHFTNHNRDAVEELLQWDSQPATTEFLSTFQARDANLRSVVINVSQLCNLRCAYCYAEDGTYGSQKGLIDIKKAQWQIKTAIGRLPRGDEFEIRFFGGEPLLHPEAVKELVDVAEACAQQNQINLRFEIVTNGTLVTGKIAQYLAVKKFGVTVSVDGSPDVQNNSRPLVNGGGSSEKLEAGVRNLMMHKTELRFLRSNTVLGSHNLDFKTSFLYAEQLGFDVIGFGYAVDDNDVANSKLFVQNLKDLCATLWNDGGEARLRKFLWVNVLFDQMDRRYRRANYCLAGKSMASIDTKNDWYLCNRFTGLKAFQLGTAEDGLHAGYMAAFKQDQISKPACSSCEVRNLCGGGCYHVHYTKTGSALNPDATYCFRQKEFYKTGIEYYVKCLTRESENETH